MMTILERDGAPLVQSLFTCSKELKFTSALKQQRFDANAQKHYAANNLCFIA